MGVYNWWVQQHGATTADTSRSAFRQAKRDAKDALLGGTATDAQKALLDQVQENNIFNKAGNLVSGLTQTLGGSVGGPVLGAANAISSFATTLMNASGRSLDPDVGINRYLKISPIAEAVGTLLSGESKSFNKADEITDVADAIGGVNYQLNAAQDVAGKRFAFGIGLGSANRQIDSADEVQNNFLDSDTYKFSTLGKKNNIATDISNRSLRNYMARDYMGVGRNGLKIITVQEAKAILNSRKESELPAFKDGGKMNIIPEGTFHSRKHHLDKVDENLEDVTPKGIPVVTLDENDEVVQVAEIEVNEIIFTLEVTKKLEELAKDGSDEAALEAGKLLVEEILNNTNDKTGLLNEEKK